ncbi:MAG: long-chain acyl-CoA synthetase [Mycobacterium sp.]|nr:long-chain acyl-CoA synthetase [Mycobacterium sp.]
MSEQALQRAASPTVLEVFRRSAARTPDQPMLVYFDTTLSVRDVDAASEALAAALRADVQPGERVALYLQNVPQYVIALLATWKLNAIAVPLNPMLTPTEVSKLLADATPRVLIALDELYTPELSGALGASSVRRVITTSALHWQSSGDDRVLPTAPAPHQGAEDLRELLARHAAQRVPEVSPRAEDVAVITYTSGTTGRPKGAMNTHGNIAAGGDAYRSLFNLDSRDAILGVAPLFHVTGLTGHIAAAITAGAPLILCYRFHTDVVLDMIRRHRPTFTVAALTVFIALLESAATRQDLASLTKIASGGAPVAAGVLERFEQKFGHYIHNVYGMTETTAPVLAVPVGTRAPVDSDTSALSVGKPVLTSRVTVLDDQGEQAAVGDVGELAATGPQIVPGYFRQAEETAAAFRGEWLLTGDVGYVDADGWFYLVDRKKDVIVASGFKVWPREVEDVLYTHPAVREAAVVGEPDAYRGETVKAFVSLREGAAIQPEELVAFCRTRLAAYKYPRTVVILDAIPKTASGKVLRRSLRHGSPAATHMGATKI